MAALVLTWAARKKESAGKREGSVAAGLGASAEAVPPARHAATGQGSEVERWWLMQLHTGNNDCGAGSPQQPLKHSQAHKVKAEIAKQQAQDRMRAE